VKRLIKSGSAVSAHRISRPWDASLSGYLGCHPVKGNKPGAQLFFSRVVPVPVVVEDWHVIGGFAPFRHFDTNAAEPENSQGLALEFTSQMAGGVEIPPFAGEGAQQFIVILCLCCLAVVMGRSFSQKVSWNGFF
jgi:hypothetical protein